VEIARKYFQGEDLCAVFCTAFRLRKLPQRIFQMEQPLDHLQPPAHEADVPVLPSAMAARPDWVLTHNGKHFTPAVAQRSGLRIAAPVEFFGVLGGMMG
jgi:hypothetical protein